MERNNKFNVDLNKADKDNIFYTLAMFPYPSGAGLHIGHAMNFTANDIIARFRRMQGYTVLNPIGWDSFWLPTEGYAMKVGKSANVVTEENVSNFIEQCNQMDRSYDRNREFATSDPEYYKRTQRIFQQLYKAGLVYRKEAFVNRCPHDQTVLANDQVVNGECERCGTEVVQKKHMQRFIKITDYAERLINDLDAVDRPEETKTQQKYWIGKSEGAEIDFAINESEKISNVIVLHGIHDDARAWWRKWFAEECEKNGIPCYSPQCDHENGIVLEKDIEAIIEQCGDKINEHTVIVGYSLGGLTAKHLIVRMNKKIKKLVTVASSFSRPVTGDEAKEVDIIAYRDTPLDEKKFNNLVEEHIAYFSKDDPAIPFELAVPHFQQHYPNVRILTFADKWHFNKHFWVLEIPELLEDTGISSLSKKWTVVALHGMQPYNKNEEKWPHDKRHWFPWLKQTLEDKWYEVYLPVVPNGWEGNYENWKAELDKLADKVNEDTIFVGTSSWGAAMVRRLGDNKKKIRKLILVAPAYAPWVAHYDDRKEFNEFEIDKSLSKRVSDGIFVLLSNDEPLIIESSRIYLEELQATLIEVPDRGHFTEGYSEKNKQIPEVVDLIEPKITVFTTRPDTIYGVTAIMLAPENESIDVLLSPENKAKLEEYRKATGKKTALERQQDAEEKSGMFSGVYAKHPLTGEQVPVWYADYVLPDYATGAVMFVPAHDERDWKFAKAHDLPIKQVIHDESFEGGVCNTGAWVLINSGDFNDITNEEAKSKITTYLEEQWLGRRKTTYKLRDWSISRQRYWGCPIPFYYTFDSEEQVPFFMYAEGNKAFKPGEPVTPRQVIQCIVKDKSGDEYCFLKWAHDGDVTTFFWGTEWEDAIEAAKRELLEEWGFADAELVKELWEYHVQFYHPTKHRNQYSINHLLYFEVDRSKQAEPTDEEAKKLHEIVWMSAEEFIKTTRNDTSIFAMNRLLKGDSWIKQTTERYNAYNPHPDKAKWIPHVIPEDELPVVLPLDVKDYKPAGKSPLADHPTFPHYKPENYKVPFFEYTDEVRGYKKEYDVRRRNVVHGIVRHAKTWEIALLKRSIDGSYTFPSGGLEWDESREDAVKREIREETGIMNIEIKEQIGGEIHRKFYHALKKENHYTINKYYLVEAYDWFSGISEEEKAKHEPLWMNINNVKKVTTDPDLLYVLELLEGREVKAPAYIDRFNEYNPQPTYLRECDTLDTFMDSAFYFLRFIDPHNDKELLSKDLADKTLPVDFYIGGKEHTYGHLLYSRFINKFLYDQGYIGNSEPFAKLFHQGFVLGPDGRKMSKRRGNVINPSEVVDEVGSDTARTYTMFMGPIEQEKIWNPNALSGVKKFIERVERAEQFISEDGKEIDPVLHKTIKWVTEDIERVKFNTAVSKLMVFVNELYDKKSITKQQFSTFLQLLAPFATKLSSEMREKLGNEWDIHFSKWPTFDPDKIAEDTINLPVQINGKMKGTIEVAAGISQDEVVALVKADERFSSQFEGKEIVKIIFVQDKIVNFIVK